MPTHSNGLPTTINMSHSADPVSSGPQAPRYPTPVAYIHGGSASPVSLTSNSSSTSLQGIVSAKPKMKPANIFSNDGSFLERFQRNKMEEQEKQKVQDEINRKIKFEDRFKNRAKRKLQPSEDEANGHTMNSSSRTFDTGADVSISQGDHPAKRLKVEEPLDQYQQELKKYQASKDGLTNAGTGFRPLVK